MGRLLLLEEDWVACRTGGDACLGAVTLHQHLDRAGVGRAADGFGGA
ncbi:hypothetical protein [Streptomyces sp. 135]|nr:hypothetical protein [Streptomyces sp. 135]